MNRRALTFDCQGDRLVGVLHEAATPGPRVALIVVGGPQYRVGSHRQFLSIASALAGVNIATLRFDYRGMGDSEGDARTFEQVDDDIRCAIDTLFDACPGAREVTLIGLCDAASACLMYAPSDQRVGSLVLMNPWVHTPAGAARAAVRHYYLRRLFDRAFWRKLIGGGVNLRKSIGGFRHTLRRARGAAGDASGTSSRPFVERMLDGARRFHGPSLVLTSGEDMTAAQFLDLTRSDAGWGAYMQAPQTTVHHLNAANHTFARCSWRKDVNTHMVDWISAL
jgi:exosortase A-associated hydrolase 1